MIKLHKSFSLVLTAALLLVGTGCTEKQQKIAGGAAVGGITGAAVGGIVAKGAGAALGGGAGILVGAMVMSSASNNDCARCGKSKCSCKKCVSCAQKDCVCVKK